MVLGWPHGPMRPPTVPRTPPRRCFCILAQCALSTLFIPPLKHTSSTRSRAAAPASGAVVPSGRLWATLRPRSGGVRAPWTVERRACRSSAPAGSCNCAMGGAAAPSACAAWAARARPWRRAPTTRDGPAQPPGTTPHRSADTLRSVPGAGGAIELALLCAAA